MLNIYKQLLFLFLTCISTKSVAQLYNYQASEIISEVLSDENGNVYLGTATNICQFNGQELTSNCFSAQDGNFSLSIVVSSNLAFRANNQYLTVFETGNSIKVETLPEMITCFAYFDQQLYVGTGGGGLIVYHTKTKKWSTINSVNAQFINGLDVFDNKLFIAHDNGLGMLDLTNQINYVEVAGTNELIIDVVTHDQNGVLAFGYSGNLYKIDGKGKIVNRQLFDQGEIQKVSSSKNETYFTTATGVYRMDNELRFQLIHEGEFLSILAHDNLLLLSKQEQLYAFDITQESLIKTQNNYSLFVDQDAAIWVGSKGVVYKYDDYEFVKKIQLPSKLTDLQISSVFVTKNKLFVGTLGDGLYIFSLEGKFLDHLLFDVDENKKNIIQIREADGLLWIAYLTGLLTIDPDNHKIVNDFEHLTGNQYVYCFLPISQTDFFIGTFGDGVLHYKNDSISVVLKDQSIYSLVKHQNHIFAGTEKKGVYEIYTTNNNVNYEKQIFVTDEVLNLVSIGKNLLVTGENNNYILNPVNLGTYKLPNPTLKNQHINANASTQQYVYIGFEDGISRLNKFRLNELAEIKAHITKILIFDRVADSSQHFFEHNENTLTFNFESKSIYQPQNTYFKYRLIGVDSNWVVNSQTSVTYYNLHPGEYRFEVALGIGKFFNPTNATSFEFEIGKPFWDQTWFWLLVALVLILIIYGWIKYRERKVLAEEKQKNARLKFEFESLKSQIDPHFLFNSLNSLLELIEESPTEAANSVSQLSNLYRNVLEYQNIDKISLDLELEIGIQYFEIHKIRYRHLISIEIDENLANVNGFVVPMSCQFLIENAIKHNVISKQNVLKVKIYREDNYLVIENNKTQTKLLATSSKLGLNNLNQRYLLISGKEIIIEDTSSFFKVKLPILHD